MHFQMLCAGHGRLLTRSIWFAAPATEASTRLASAVAVDRCWRCCWVQATAAVDATARAAGAAVGYNYCCAFRHRAQQLLLSITSAAAPIATACRAVAAAGVCSHGCASRRESGGHRKHTPQTYPQAPEFAEFAADAGAWQLQADSMLHSHISSRAASAQLAAAAVAHYLGCCFSDAATASLSPLLLLTPRSLPRLPQVDGCCKRSCAGDCASELLLAPLQEHSTAGFCALLMLQRVPRMRSCCCQIQLLQSLRPPHAQPLLLPLVVMGAAAPVVAAHAAAAVASAAAAPVVAATVAAAAAAALSSMHMQPLLITAAADYSRN